MGLHHPTLLVTPSQQGSISLAWGQRTVWLQHKLHNRLFGEFFFFPFAPASPHSIRSLLWTDLLCSQKILQLSLMQEKGQSLLLGQTDREGRAGLLLSARAYSCNGLMRYNMKLYPKLYPGCLPPSTATTDKKQLACNASPPFPASDTWHFVGSAVQLDFHHTKRTFHIHHRSLCCQRSKGKDQHSEICLGHISEWGRFCHSGYIYNGLRRTRHNFCCCSKTCLREYGIMMEKTHVDTMATRS